MRILSDAEVEERKQQLYSADIIHEWEYTGFQGFPPKFQWYITLAGGFIPTSIIGIVLLLTNGFIFEWGAFITLAIIAVIATLIMRYIPFVSAHYCYKLTQYGIFYTVDYLVPEIIYTVFRRFAWFGMAVCLIGLIVLGPMAFIGVGATALLSFPLASIKRRLQYDYVVFPAEIWIKFFRDRRTIQISSLDTKISNTNCDFTDRLYCQNLEEIMTIKSILQTLLPHAEFIEVDSEDVLTTAPDYARVRAKMDLKLDEENFLDEQIAINKKKKQ